VRAEGFELLLHGPARDPSPQSAAHPSASAAGISFRLPCREAIGVVVTGVQRQPVHRPVARRGPISRRAVLPDPAGARTRISAAGPASHRAPLPGAGGARTSPQARRVQLGGQQHIPLRRGGPRPCTLTAPSQPSSIDRPIVASAGTPARARNRRRLPAGDRPEPAGTPGAPSREPAAAGWPRFLPASGTFVPDAATEDSTLRAPSGDGRPRGRFVACRDRKAHPRGDKQ
jgi:hypothetical protein